MDITEAKQINRLLREKYGCGISGRPRYRLMWSEDLLEYRQKTNPGCSDDGQVEQLKKYAYIKDRWILEWLADGPAEVGEIKLWDGYEAFYNFSWPGGDYQEPSFFHCDFLCFAHDNMKPTTKEEAYAEEAAKQAKEIAESRAEFEEVGKLRIEDSVGYTGKEFTGEG